MNDELRAKAEDIANHYQATAKELLKQFFPECASNPKWLEIAQDVLLIAFPALHETMHVKQVPFKAVSGAMMLRMVEATQKLASKKASASTIEAIAKDLAETSFPPRANPARN